MPRRLAVLALALAAFAGCGEGGRAPGACGSGAGAIEASLARAPEPARIAGVPLSECFDAESDAAEVQRIGGDFLRVAQRLGDRRDALRLGYLVGAVERGSRGSGGHAELVRRIGLEAEPLRRSAAFRSGHAAGLRTG